MKRIIAATLVLFVSVVLFTSSTNAQTRGNGNQSALKTNWVDLNGDGICDNVGTSAQGSNKGAKGYGKKDGTGTQTRPMDGTGYGKKAGIASGNGNSIGSQGSNGRGYRGNK